MMKENIMIYFIVHLKLDATFENVSNFTLI
jgi:hypothetical protein